MSMAAPGKNILLRAGCKVNLSLHIHCCLDNGYHDLRTLYFPLPEPCDLLHIGPALPGSGLNFCCSLPELENKDNLVVETYRLFCLKTGTRPDLAVRLEKHIPHGAGLGGGSSDAARMLAYLNEIAGPNALPLPELRQTAEALGADVPFFLEDKPMWGEGTGTRLRAADIDLTGLTLLLLCPGVAVSTPWAYRRWDESVAGKRLTGQNILTSGTLPDKITDCASGFLGVFNSLEHAVFPAYPELREIKEQCLRLGAAGALMSGSGSTVFALFRKPEQARDAASALRPCVDAVFIRYF